MRFAALTMPTITKMVFATVLIGAPFAAPQNAAAQGSQPQPYSSQDPQNYGNPASQSYYGGQGQSYPQQQQGYADQSNGYPQNSYDQAQYGGPQQGQQQIYQAPPPLPAYDQPEAPGDGYIWTPGYWAYGPGGYYWVAGQWVEPPYEEALWTPGYWGFGYGGGYFWNRGYWGPAIGFYGGINYGFGYFGTGFYGGYWRDRHFFYNREYAHVGFSSRYVYNQRFNNVNGIRPGGQSFTTHVEVGNQFRGGSYNQNRGNFGGGQAQTFRGGQPGLGASSMTQRGYQPQATTGRPGYQPQTTTGRPGYSYAGPSNGFGGGNRGYTQPQQQQAPQQLSQPQSGSSRPAPPQSFRQSAPTHQHFSAPSGNGGFHGGGGGGGGSTHGGGGHR